MSQIRKADEESFAQAKQILAHGGLVVMPTDTVYGIVCDPCNPEAIARIYKAKGRPQYKALQVIMASVDDLDALGLDLPSPLNRLAAQFLPGAFSPIAVARDSSPLTTVRVAPNGARTQGIRVPNSVTALAMLRVTGPVYRSHFRLPTLSLSGKEKRVGKQCSQFFFPHFLHSSLHPLIPKPIHACTCTHTQTHRVIFTQSQS